MSRTAATDERKKIGGEFSYSVRSKASTFNFILTSYNSGWADACESEFTCLVRHRLTETASEAGNNHRYFAQNGSTNDRGFELFASSTDDTFLFRITNGVTNQTVTCSQEEKKNAWRMIGMVYEQGARLGMIINDTIYNETTPTIDLSMTNNAMSWGAFGVGGNYTEMLMEECILLDKALTTKEVGDFYTDFILPDDANILIHYRPNTGSGSAVTDLSGNGFNGLINGSASGAWISDVSRASRSAASGRTAVSNRTQL